MRNNMTLPDYKKGSIVNLTSSILDAFGIGTRYHPLKELKSIKESRNVILLVIDGLGYEYIKRNGKQTFFNQHMKRSLTSVFPSTTASAITTFETGVAPNQHAITGWYMYLKEMGVVSKILPFMPRYGGKSFSSYGIEKKDIYSERGFAEKMKSGFYKIYPEDIMDGKVNIKKKNILVYRSINGMFSQIIRLLQHQNGRKYIYAYWPEFDSLSHRNGVGSKIVLEHYKLLEKKLVSFIKKLKGTESALIVTSDHGLIDTPKEKIIFANDHQKFYETLSLPLCGEPRVAYCYVKPSKKDQFEKYVKRDLSYCCDLHKSEDLVERGMFGLFKPNKKLFDRIGDYIIVMKDNFIIKDALLGEKTILFKGNHGGLSKEEMLVPLILINN